jgi:catechol 2,3-dioxygenase-like lactoylglutathione lyase family enzyme
MEFLHFGLKVDDISATSGLLGRLLGVSFEPIEQYAIELDFVGGPEPGRTLVTHGLTEHGVEIELVQAIDGRVPDTEVLGTRQGVSHIAYRVDDLEAATVDAAQAGLNPVCSYHSDYVDFAFYSGPELGGLLLQFVQFHGERK